MEKTKLGIGVGMVGAACYLLGLFGGYVITGVLAGYILLKEESTWLKKQAVNVIALMLGFSVLSVAVSLIPNLLGLLYDLVGIFGANIYLGVIERLFDLLSSALSLIRTVVFILLGIIAASGKEIKLPVVEGYLEKYFG